MSTLKMTSWSPEVTKAKSLSSVIVPLVLLQIVLICQGQMIIDETNLQIENQGENILDSIEISREEIRHLREQVTSLSAEMNRQRDQLSNDVKRSENLARSEIQSSKEETKTMIHGVAEMISQHCSDIASENLEMRRKIEEHSTILASLSIWNSTILEQLNDLKRKNMENEQRTQVLEEENRSLRSSLTELNKLWTTTGAIQEQVFELKNTSASAQRHLSQVRTTLEEHNERIKVVLQKNSVLEEYIPNVFQLNSSLLTLTSAQQDLRTLLDQQNRTVESHILDVDRRSREQEHKIGQTNSSLLRELDKLRFENQRQLENISNEVNPGNYESTYVRWGRTVCPGNATVVYKGYMGGSMYTDKGGGSNYLCLTDSPQLGTNNKPGFQNGGSFLYGAEYEMSVSNSPFLTINNVLGYFQNLNPPCVLCRTPGRSQQIMIPGRTTCPPAWRFQYKGYLVTAHRTHYKMEYICLDEAPEVTPNSVRNENGALLFMVEASCGSLPCPKYVAGSEIACVVCIM